MDWKKMNLKDRMWLTDTCLHCVLFSFFFKKIQLKTKQICKTEGLLNLNLLLFNSMYPICLFLLRTIFLECFENFSVKLWGSLMPFSLQTTASCFKTASPFLCVCLCVYVCGGFALSSLIILLLEMLPFRCHSGEFSHLSLDWNKTRMWEPNWASLMEIHAINPRKKKAKNAFEWIQTETNQTNSQKVGYPTFHLCTPNAAVMRKILNSFSRLALIRFGISATFQTAGSNSKANSVTNTTDIYLDLCW